MTDELRTRAIYWPSEWVVERAFWREVATRTLAAFLAAVLVGVPVVLFAALNGNVAWTTAGPILLGALLYAILAIAYVALISFIRFRVQRADDVALLARATSWPTDQEIQADLSGALDSMKQLLESPEVEAALARQRSINGAFIIISVVAGLVGIVIPFVIFLIPGLVGFAE